MNTLRRARAARRAAMLGVVVAAVVALSGCLQIDTTVNVNPDGSGTVDQTVVMKSEILAMMQGFSAASQGSDSQSPDSPTQFSLYNEQELQQNAAKMGDGVTLKSSEPVQNDFGSGYHVVYAFNDINKIKVNQNPTDVLPSDLTSGQMGAAGGPPTGSTAPENLQFHFTRGNPSVLQVQFPPRETGAPAGADTAGGPSQQMSSDEFAMMQEFYRDMKFTVTLAFNGSIVDTNATYRTGNRITVMDMNFNNLLDDPNFQKSLQSGQGGPPQDLEQLAKMYPGLKFETKPAVTVRFQ